MDGVTVAKEIELADMFENMAARCSARSLRKIHLRHRRRDGTTTATVLAAAIVKEGPEGGSRRMNLMDDLKRCIDLAVETVVEELKKNSMKVTSNAEIAQVGTISANGDKEIGDYLAKAMEKVGNEGHHGRRAPRAPRPSSTSSRACSSTAAISRRLHHQRRQDAR